MCSTSWGRLLSAGASGLHDSQGREGIHDIDRSTLTRVTLPGSSQVVGVGAVGASVLGRGRRSASVDDLASLEETLDIAGRPTLIKQIRVSLGGLAAGDAEVLTKDEILRSLSE